MPLPPRACASSGCDWRHSASRRSTSPRCGPSTRSSRCDAVGGGGERRGEGMLGALRGVSSLLTRRRPTPTPTGAGRDQRGGVARLPTWAVAGADLDLQLRHARLVAVDERHAYHQHHLCHQARPQQTASERPLAVCPARSPSRSRPPDPSCAIRSHAAPSAYRREKLRFLTREAIHMRNILTKYAEVVLANLVKRMRERDAMQREDDN